MIKFYQGQWSAISGKTTSTNNIVFVTDRQVLMMGGKEYGKDGGAIKIEAGSGYTAAGAIADLGARGVANGTLFYFTGDQSLLKYVSGTAWEPVQTPTLSAADLISSNADASGSIVFTTRGNSDTYKATTADIASAVTTLEDKVEAAYENNGTSITHDTSTPNKLSANHIVVSKASGIGKTDYVLDNGQIAAEVLTAAEASGKSAALDTTLVNGRTAAKIVEEISKNKTTLTSSIGNGADFITWTSASTVADGTTWTPTFHVTLTGANALVNNNGTLETALEIKQLSTGMDGYNEGFRSQYALFNVAGGQSVQLGQTINLVKDQFLKSATYEIAYLDTTNGGKWYEYNKETSAWYLVDAEGKRASSSTPSTDISNCPTPNGAPRCLKLVFALTNKTDDGGAVDGDADSVVYIDVNELFDSYTGVSGVNVNQTTNQISAVVDPSTEAGSHHSGNYLTVGANGLKVDGIKEEITGYIQDLSSYTSEANYKFLTGFGVDSTGKLTGSTAQASAQFVQFSGITAAAGTADAYDDARVAVTGSNVDAALNSISNTIAKLDYSYNGSTGTATTPDRANGDTRTYFIYDITQTDGQIETHAKPLDGGELQATSKAGAKLSTILLTVNEAGAVTSTKQAEDGQVYAISTTASQVGSLQTAIDTIVTSVTDTFADLNMTQVGAGIDTTNAKKSPNTATGSEDYDTFKIVNTIIQNNGYVNATQLDLIAQNVGFEPIVSSATHIPVAGYSVGKALSSISQYIGSLDFTDAGAGTAPSSGTDNKYSIVNTVAQDNGLISETKIDLTAANTHQTGITEALDTGTTAANARVGITKGTVQEALVRISNILGDYLSFHDKDDKLITSAN